MASFDSSSSTLGRITWQTSMGMTNEGTNPAISDEFRTNRWTTDQVNQGMIKYTQYVETGRDFDEGTNVPAENASDWASAVAAVSMKINGVEKVDFGWLQQPKFVCFTNSTPEGAAPATIFIGVQNNEAADELDDGLGDALLEPPWFLSQKVQELSSGADWDATWTEFCSEHGIPPETDYDTVLGWGENNFCQNVFEVPPQVTIGPIIVPDDATYWVYKNANTNDQDINNSNSAYPGAILITEAYDA